MDSISDEYLENTILKSCFPRASRIRIVDCRRIENLGNASSEIARLAVELEEGAGRRHAKLILKIPHPTTTPMRAYCAELGFYSKEKRMLQLMMPLLNAIPLASRKLPVCYLTIDEGTVVLEDLAARGYSTASKSKFFDLRECGPIFEAIAAFHAATYKVHREHPGLLTESTFQRTVPVDVRQDFAKTWQPVICELYRRKDASRLPKFEAAVELLRQPNANVYAMLSPARFKCVLLNHGDLRQDNVMLKLDEEGRIADAKLIDFQACWWSTPAYDFLLFVTFCVPVEVLDQQFDELVDAYWRPLNQALVQLGCSVDYEKTDFLDDVRRLRFLHLMWLTARCAFTCPLEPQKLATTFQRDDQQTFQLCCECLDDERFTQSLWGWLQYCEKLKIFDAMADEVARQRQTDEGLPK